jgi:hypothetical protein
MSGIDGQLYPIKLPATAGNVDSDIIVPSNVSYEMMWGQVVLTTDATVANRRVVLEILDPDLDVVFDIHAGATVPASQAARHHEHMKGVFRETSFIGDALQVPIPFDLILPPKFRLRVTIENGQAGDSYYSRGMILRR